jgi:hypothetical protein
MGNASPGAKAANDKGRAANDQDFNEISTIDMGGQLSGSTK